MKFTVNRIELLKKLRDVQLAISNKTTIPILTGLKIEAKNDGLKLTGSNSDISIETKLFVEDENAQLVIEETGDIVLQPARFFADIINRLSDDSFTFEVNTQLQASITSANSFFTINALDASSYPYLPEIDTTDSFTLSVRLLKRVIEQTVIAVSKHESRPILTGVNFSIHEGKLKAVATDSHRLSQRIIPVNVPEDLTFQIVIPGNSLLELSKILTDDIEEVNVALAENQILFTTEDTYFYSRLLEGKYPQTDQLIPEESSTQLTLNVQTLKGAVGRTSLLSHAGKNNVVKLSVTDDHIQLTSNSPEVGFVEEDVPSKSIAGDEVEISFNPDYLRDALNTFESGEVTLKLISTLRPFVIVPAESENNYDFVQLITPIRTSAAAR
ncbi:DNA polymerase-3 subunit beta [Atopostipes suicloacalis DSM 15692]|uniref:Beta sliding clamp n=1 Tax=Atopostipes suicloacalis DSM 15692 TaxID=1121025 RepID=A0A1M4X6F3_9LACT|nr:DNA polymerase III subunit beta [Atopostipes suicloacalis]SHE89026.1 DNA polymerase-3 subunit beta [Atopostipes suicloacalis DSM 15692]